jgi:hypothetical protein
MLGIVANCKNQMEMKSKGPPISLTKIMRSKDRNRDRIRGVQEVIKTMGNQDSFLPLFPSFKSREEITSRLLIKTGRNQLDSRHWKTRLTNSLYPQDETKISWVTLRLKMTVKERTEAITRAWSLMEIAQRMLCLLTSQGKDHLDLMVQSLLDSTKNQRLSSNSSSK